MNRNKRCSLVMLAITVVTCLPGTFSLDTGARKDTIEGSVVFPKGGPVQPDTYVTLFSGEGSRRRKVFPNADGTFSIEGVEDGMHSLDVESIGYFFPTIKIIKHGNIIKATASDVQDAQVPYPLKIFPMKEMVYFEQRQKFDLVKWLKTPYGIMIAFGLASIVLLPMLKIDPEEYRQMKEITSGKKTS